MNLLKIGKSVLIRAAGAEESQSTAMLLRSIRQVTARRQTEDAPLREYHIGTMTGFTLPVYVTPVYVTPIFQTQLPVYS